MKQLLLALILFPVTAFTQEPVSISPDSLEQYINEFQQAFDEPNQLSGVLYIAYGDEVLHFKAYGENIELNSRFPIASITKIFSIIILNNLAIEGRIDPNETVSKWIKDFPDGDSITVLQLAQHRSGINHRVTSDYEESMHYSAREIVEKAKLKPLAFEPGTERGYSTAGYSVLARIMELVEGKSFAEILKERIFQPAGMNSSFDLTEPDEKPQFIPSFLPKEDKLVPAPDKDLSFLVGGGSSVSTAEDLLSFVNTLKNEAIGSVTLENVASNGTARWVGASNGYFTWIDVFPSEGLTIIYLGNTWGGASIALKEALLSYFRGTRAEPPTIPKSVEMPSLNVMKEYNGKYKVRLNFSYTVDIKEGFPTFEDNYLVPVDTDKFWVPSWSEILEFQRDNKGAVIGLKREDGTEWPKE